MLLLQIILNCLITSGRTVNIGTFRTNPPNDSIGKWLQDNVIKTAIASYVWSILIREGHAKKADGPYMKFYERR